MTQKDSRTSGAGNRRERVGQKRYHLYRNKTPMGVLGIGVLCVAVSPEGGAWDMPILHTIPTHQDTSPCYNPTMSTTTQPGLYQIKVGPRTTYYGQSQDLRKREHGHLHHLRKGTHHNPQKHGILSITKI
jgi:hypothetical protein